MAYQTSQQAAASGIFSTTIMKNSIQPMGSPRA
jgi:hypothetical protein